MSKPKLLLPGHTQPEPQGVELQLLQASAGVDPSGTIVLTVALMNGTMIVPAKMSPEVAWTIVLQLGAAIEQTNPGNLLRMVEQWAALIRQQQDEGRRILAEVGIGGNGV